MHDSPGTLRPLTDQQQTMLAFMGGTRDQFYLIIESFILRGELALGRFRQALDVLVRRHEVLRSVVIADSGSYSVSPHETSTVDRVLTIRRDIDDISHALRAGQEHAGRCMELDREFPLRVWLAVVSPGESVLVICGHHLFFDGWSWRNFYRELEQAYLDPDSLPPPKQYHETAISGDVGDLSLSAELFRRRYRGVRELQARASTPVGPAGAVQVKQGPDLAAALSRECGARAATPYALAVSSFLVSLGNALADPEIIVGTASSGRSTGAALGALGYFSNTIFVGTGGGTPEEVLHDVQEQLARWRTSPRVQWERILGEYGGQDLYPIRFGFERAGKVRPDARFADVMTDRAPDNPGDGVARRVAVISGTYDKAGVTLTAQFRLDVVTEEWMRGLLEQCLALLEAMCAGGQSSATGVHGRPGK
jgi:mycobactin peptide synthetase MbtE